MGAPATTKTESRAINSLENIIDNHLDMDYDFNRNDKEMSWDGFIWLYKCGTSTRAKKNTIARIAVQIKGHSDSEHKYINKQCISYYVDLEDLELYSTEKGVVYFLIFIDKAKTSIFYCSLYPSKIADYLDKAKQENKKKKKRIQFVRLDKNPEKLYKILLQFNTESQKQGTSHTEIVLNRIRIQDLSRVKEISMSVVGANNPVEAFLRLNSGDVCLYGKFEGDSFFRPIQWEEDAEYYLHKEVEQSVIVDETEYYKHYNAELNKQGGMIITFSPNLQFNIETGKISFVPKSSITEIYNDVCFLQALMKANAYYVGEHCFEISNFTYDELFEKRIRFFIDAFETLRMIDFDTDIPFDSNDKIKVNQLINLVDLRYRTSQGLKDEQYRKINWTYGEGSYPLIEKDDGKSIELFSLIYTKKLGTFVEGEDETTKEKKMYSIPLFLVAEAETLANLCIKRYEVLWEQIKAIEVNKWTYTCVQEGLLKLISAFDIGDDTEFLNMADELSNRIMQYSHNDFDVLNQMQIKKRIGSFDKKDESLLLQIESDNIEILFGKAVLLNDKCAADAYLAQMDNDRREKYIQYPVYRLFEHL